MSITWGPWLVSNKNVGLETGQFRQAGPEPDGARGRDRLLRPLRPPRSRFCSPFPVSVFNASPFEASSSSSWRTRSSVGRPCSRTSPGSSSPTPPSSPASSTPSSRRTSPTPSSPSPPSSRSAHLPFPLPPRAEPNGGLEIRTPLDTIVMLPRMVEPPPLIQLVQRVVMHIRWSVYCPFALSSLISPSQGRRPRPRPQSPRLHRLPPRRPRRPPQVRPPGQHGSDAFSHNAHASYFHLCPFPDRLQSRLQGSRQVYRRVMSLALPGNKRCCIRSKTIDLRHKIRSVHLYRFVFMPSLAK